MPIIRGKLFGGGQPLVKVKISNFVGVPEDSAPPPESLDLWALIDTGTTGSALDEGICKRLQLMDTGLVSVLGAGADTSHNFTKFAASMEIYFDHTGGARYDWDDVIQFICLPMNDRNYKVVLGMDVISRGSLRIENNGQAIEFEVK